VCVYETKVKSLFCLPTEIGKNKQNKKKENKNTYPIDITVCQVKS
jgi:hypothetical protein